MKRPARSRVLIRSDRAVATTLVVFIYSPLVLLLGAAAGIGLL